MSQTVWPDLFYADADAASEFLQGQWWAFASELER